MDVATELHQRLDASRGGSGVEASEQFGSHILHVVGVGDERVPTVPGDHYVARRIHDRDTVGGGVGLYISAVVLRFETRDQFVEVIDEAVEPRPDLHHGAWKVAAGP